MVYPKFTTHEVLVCTIFISIIANQVSEGSRLNADSSIAREGMSSLWLSCTYFPSANGTIQEVSWSKVRGDDVVLFFEKRVTSNYVGEYEFFGSWRQREAQHDVMTLADVTLSGSDVTRDDAGTYRCEVSEDNTVVIRNETRVTVLYGPRSTTQITSLHGSFHVREGDTIALQCSASCLPACSYRWTCSGCMATREDTLTLTNIQRDQRGTYTCLSHNTVSRGRAEATLDVLYPANVKSLTFAEGEEATLLQVPEGQSVTISCQAKGNPAPHNITWSATGQSRVNRTYFMSYGHDESSVFVLPSVGCHDNDKYTCTAANNLGLDAKSAQLQVQCAPTPTSRCPYRPTNTTIIIARYSHSLNITLCVLARPRPSVTWFRYNDVIVDDQDVTYDDVSAMLMTLLNLEDVRKESYGTYRVVFHNEFGVLEENVTLAAQEPPQTPTNMTIFNVTVKSFCLTWIPGFDGGAPQTFRLTYFASADDLSSHDLVDFDERIIDADVAVYCIQKLQPATTYGVTLSSANMYGTRNDSQVQMFVLTPAHADKVRNDEANDLDDNIDDSRNDTGVDTETETQEAEKANRDLALVVGSAAPSSLLLLMCVACVVWWRRKRRVLARALEDRQKMTTIPLSFSNENARLSYLELSQANYVDASSRFVDDATGSCVTNDHYDVAHDTSRRGSRNDLGRTLGVHELSHRRSSTQSSNIYLDIMGDPATYINQSRSSRSGSIASQRSNDDDRPSPSPSATTSMHLLSGADSKERLRQLLESYADMTQGMRDVNAINENSRIDDVTVKNSGMENAVAEPLGIDDVTIGNPGFDDASLDSAEYDDAWESGFEHSPRDDEGRYCKYSDEPSATELQSPSQSKEGPQQGNPRNRRSTSSRRYFNRKSSSTDRANPPLDYTNLFEVRTPCSPSVEDGTPSSGRGLLSPKGSPSSPHRTPSAKGKMSSAQRGTPSALRRTPSAERTPSLDRTPCESERLPSEGRGTPSTEGPRRSQGSSRRRVDVPTITITNADEVQESAQNAYDACRWSHYDDDEHVYDVINDNDVRD